MVPRVANSGGNTRSVVNRTLRLGGARRRTFSAFHLPAATGSADSGEAAGCQGTSRIGSVPNLEKSNQPPRSPVRDSFS